MFVFITILIVNACIAGTIPATPENITVTFLTPTTVRVSWQTMIDLNAHPVEKYIVTYKPTDDRVVQDVAGNSEAIILDRLSPSTQYSIAVTAIWLGKKYRSRQIIFRTLDLPKPASQQDLLNGVGAGSGILTGNMAGANNNLGTSGFGRASNDLNGSGSSIYGDDVTSTVTNTLSNRTHRELPTIRGVEIGIVLIVLMVWAGAIALFFNRWGKIRMLLPYQPDFKNEQLKVPGTGVCSAGGCNGQHSHQFDSSELHRYNSRHFHMLHEERSTSISERCTRSRINSAIFVSSEGRGFDSIEFLRRHGSQSVLCRKARSAENITDNGRKKSFSDQRQWRTDEEPELRELNTSKPNTEDIELKESRCGTEARVLSVLNSNAEQTTAVTTAANLIVGSISIEAPPSNMNIFDDTSSVKSMKIHTAHASIASTTSASHDSADTVEELIQITASTANTAATATITIAPSTTILPSERKSRILVRQRSSTASPIGLRSQSPAGSIHGNPKSLTLKSVKPKIISNLPMVSVSGPSPQEEKPECL